MIAYYPKPSYAMEAMSDNNKLLIMSDNNNYYNHNHMMKSRAFVNYMPVSVIVIDYCLHNHQFKDYSLCLI